MSSSATSISTDERVMSRSPWVMVTVLLANDRPACMRSTAISRSASGRPARGKTVWIVFTVMASLPRKAATIDCASSWPPNTTPCPPRLVAV